MPNPRLVIIDPKLLKKYAKKNPEIIQNLLDMHEKKQVCVVIHQYSKDGYEQHNSLTKANLHLKQEDFDKLGQLLSNTPPVDIQTNESLYLTADKDLQNELKLILKDTIDHEPASKENAKKAFNANTFETITGIKTFKKALQKATIFGQFEHVLDLLKDTHKELGRHSRRQHFTDQQIHEMWTDKQIHQINKAEKIVPNFSQVTDFEDKVALTVEHVIELLYKKNDQDASAKRFINAKGQRIDFKKNDLLELQKLLNESLPQIQQMIEFHEKSGSDDGWWLNRSKYFRRAVGFLVSITILLPLVIIAFSSTNEYNRAFFYQSPTEHAEEMQDNMIKALAHVDKLLADIEHLTAEEVLFKEDQTPDGKIGNVP